MVCAIWRFGFRNEPPLPPTIDRGIPHPSARLKKRDNGLSSFFTPTRKQPGINHEFDSSYLDKCNYLQHMHRCNSCRTCVHMRIKSQVDQISIVGRKNEVVRMKEFFKNVIRHIQECKHSFANIRFQVCLRRSEQADVFRHCPKTDLSDECTLPCCKEGMSNGSRILKSTVSFALWLDHSLSAVLHPEVQGPWMM